jgi:hypothetical protein
MATDELADNEGAISFPICPRCALEHQTDRGLVDGRVLPAMYRARIPVSSLPLLNTPTALWG